MWNLEGLNKIRRCWKRSSTLGDSRLRDGKLLRGHIVLKDIDDGDVNREVVDAIVWDKSGFTCRGELRHLLECGDE
jgi:hypothetical protein